MAVLNAYCAGHCIERSDWKYAFVNLSLVLVFLVMFAVQHHNDIKNKW